MMEDEKKPKGRSPSYPGISLDLAVDKAKIAYERQSRHAGSVEALMTAWGYSPKSGPGSVTLAALRKYGLLEVEGVGKQRKARLTPLALRILLDPDDSARRQAIQTAALTPSIHTELWDLYAGDLPKDDVLRYELLMERGFTESGVSEFLAQFRRTIDYAQLARGGRVSSDAGPADQGDSMPAATAARPQPAGSIVSKTRTRSLQIPLAGDGIARVETSRPVSDAEWDMLISILPAMKRGFVTDDENPEDE
jgi:hypothetical protein